MLGFLLFKNLRLLPAMVVLGSLVLFRLACINKLTLSAGHLGHELVRHDLLVTNGVPQVVARLVLRRVNRGVAAAEALLEPLLVVLPALLRDEGQRQRPEVLA